MRWLEITNEIEQVAAIPEDNLPVLDETNSKIIGTYDGLNIYSTTYYVGHVAFCILNSNNNPIAYLVLRNDVTVIDNIEYFPSVRIWVESSERGKGLASILYAFVTQKLELNLLTDNQLTKHGMKQMQKMIDSGRFDVTFYDMMTGETTKEMPPEIFSKLPNSWRILIQHGKYINESPLVGHGVPNMLWESWYFRNSDGDTEWE